MSLSVGIDVVDTARFAAVMVRRPRIVERLFTDLERQLTREKPERLAARFAAKEATLKALHVGLCTLPWHSIEVRRERSGAPTLHLSGEAAALAAQLGLSDFALSMTHTAITSAAIVVATGESRAR